MSTPFIRSEEHMLKMTMDAIGCNVETDLEVVITYMNGKLKAYSPKLGCFLQFPKALRKEKNIRYLCDARESETEVSKFYRCYVGTIRDSEGTVVG